MPEDRASSSRNPYQSHSPNAASSSSYELTSSPAPLPESVIAAEEYELDAHHSPRSTHSVLLSPTHPSTSPPPASSSSRPPPRYPTAYTPDVPSRKPSYPLQRRNSTSNPSRSFSGVHQHPHLAQSTPSLLFDASLSPTAFLTSLPSSNTPHVNFTLEDTPLAHLASRARSSAQSRRHSTAAHLLGLGAEDETWETARGIRGEWKRKAYLLMEEPTSSESAFLLHWGTTALILFSALLTVLSTLPGYHTHPFLGRVLFGLDTSVVVLFSLEYLARCFGHSDTLQMFWAHFTSFLAIIDLLAILPYFIELLIHADTSVLFRFSILRTFRLLRVFRAFRYSSTLILTIEVMRLSIKLSQDALFALGFFITMVVIIFSTLIYFAERGTWDNSLMTFVDADGDPSNFGSIPAAAWFTIVTITTVGYGELTPRSTLGRLLSVPILVFGLLLIALPSFVLGKNFAAVWEASQRAADELGTNPLSPSPSHTSIHSSNNNNISPRSSQDESHPKRDPPSTLNGGYSTLQPNSAASSSSAVPKRSNGLRKREKKRKSEKGGLGTGSEGEDGGSMMMTANDLSNLKLARNQEALSGQIAGLREIVERQGRMVEALLLALESERKGKGRSLTTTTTSESEG